MCRYLLRCVIALLSLLLTQCKLTASPVSSNCVTPLLKQVSSELMSKKPGYIKIYIDSTDTESNVAISPNDFTSSAQCQMTVSETWSKFTKDVALALKKTTVTPINSHFEPDCRVGCVFSDLNNKVILSVFMGLDGLAEINGKLYKINPVLAKVMYNHFSAFLSRSTVPKLVGDYSSGLPTM